MVPVITKRGRSFAGAFKYFLHDKDAWTTERIAWSRCLNLMTDCAEKAWKRMAFTAMHQEELKEATNQVRTGAKMTKPVFCYSLSWHPEENPDQQTMMDAAMETLSILELTEHQTIIVAHQDTDHKHVHVITNITHPVTGLTAKLKNTKRKLSEFALNYERKEGKVYCKQRELNQQKREANQSAKYCDPVIRDAWDNSSNGQEFLSILISNGYRLAQGRRLVIVDPHGNIINPARMLGVKQKELNTKLADIHFSGLPDTNQAVQEIKDYEQKRLADEAEARYLQELLELTQSWDRKIEQKKQQLHAYYQIDTLQLELHSLHQAQNVVVFKNWTGFVTKIRYKTT